MKARLRPYDLIIRLRDDEFVCAMSNMTLLAARERFRAITIALADASDGGAIRTGFADLAPDEGATELITRARSELIASGNGKRRNQPQPDQTGANEVR
jgi:hypothetical protein